MIKHLSLGKKIGIGFSMLLVLALLVGLTGYAALKRVIAGSGLNHSINGIQHGFASAKQKTDQYMLYNHAETRGYQKEVKKSLIEDLEKSVAGFKSMKTRPGITHAEIKAMDDAGKDVTSYMSTFQQFDRIESEKEILSSEITNTSKKLSSDIGELSFWHEEMLSACNFMASYGEAYIDRNTEIRWQRLHIMTVRLGKAIEEWRKKIDNSDQLRVVGQDLEKAHQQISLKLAEHQQLVAAQNEMLQSMNLSKESLNRHLREFADASRSKMIEIERFSFLIIAIAIMAAVALGIFFGLIATRSIVMPIKHISDSLKDIARGDGDLTMRLTIDSRDEIGVLARYFNQFMEKLQKIIQEVAENATSLIGASGGLFDLSNKLSSVSSSLSDRSTSVAGSAKDMSAQMNSVAAASKQAAVNVKMVAAAVEEMTATVNEISNNTGNARRVTAKAVSQTQGASERVDELGHAANEINKVTEVITEISEQTNLLALNATIEAARAGEAGKGFAVVANEIKALARQTADATGEIKAKIQSIQSTTEGTVTEIDRIKKVITEVDDIVSTIAAAVEEQSVTTREIAGNINQAARGIDDVNQNVAESSETAEIIAQEINRVDHDAAQVSEESNQTSLSADQLSKMAELLKSLVGQFKV